jgi:uncharacterized protein YegP (UPF0339 family)
MASGDARVYFEIDRAGGGGRYWVWRIRNAGSGDILAQSEMLHSRPAAEDAIRLVRDDARLCGHVWDHTTVPGPTWAPLPDPPVTAPA